MKNKIILSTGALYHLPLSDIFSVAQKADFDGIELIIDERPESANPATLRTLIASTGIPILSIHIPMDHCAVWGHEASSIISHAFNLQSVINAQRIVFHPWRSTHAAYAVELLTLLENSHYSAVCIENLPKLIWGQPVAETYFNPIRLSEHCRQLELCLDTSHLATTNLPFREAIGPILDRVAHVHISDSNLVPVTEEIFEDEHLPVGSGKLPLTWLMEELHHHNYQGMYCFELRPTFFSGMSLDEISQTLHGLIERTRSRTLLGITAPSSR